MSTRKEALDRYQQGESARQRVLSGMYNQQPATTEQPVVSSRLKALEAFNADQAVKQERVQKAMKFSAANTLMGNNTVAPVRKPVKEVPFEIDPFKRAKQAAGNVNATHMLETPITKGLQGIHYETNTTPFQQLVEKAKDLPIYRAGATFQEGIKNATSLKEPTFKESTGNPKFDKFLRSLGGGGAELTNGIMAGGPAMGSGVIAGKVTEKAATKVPAVAARIAGGAAEGAVTNVATGMAANQTDPGEIANLAVTGGLLGGAAGTLVEGVAAGAKALGKALGTGKEAAYQVSKQEQAAAEKGNWFTRAFGQQGLGIAAGASRTGKAVNSEDVLVRNKLLQDKDGVIGSIQAGAKDAYHNFVDQYEPLKAFGHDVYEKAMDSARANNVANNITKKHFVTPEGQIVGPGLESIFKKVARGYDKQFVDYLTLRHAETRIGRGERVYAEYIKDPGNPQRAMNTVEAVQDKLARYNKTHPKWAAIAKEWDGFNENLLQHYGVNEGLISAEQFAAMREKNPFYASMMRQFSKSEKPAQKYIGAQTGAQFSGQKAPIKEVSPTGSARKIVDTRKSAIEQVGAWANASFRNRVMQGIVDKVKANPESFQGIAEIVQAPSQKEHALRQALTDPNHDYLNMLKDDFDSLFGKGKASEDNIVRAMVKGEPVYIKVHNPDIVKALAGMSPQEAGLVVGVLQKFSNAVKTGATGALAPLFATRGATVDVVASLIQSKNPIRHLGDLTHAILGSLNLPGFNKLVQEYELAGGKYSAALKGDRQLNKSLSNLERPALFSPKGVARGVTKTVTAPFRVANAVSDVAENVNRIAAYKGELRRLGGERTPDNVRKAMTEAREITTNFSRKGAKSRELEALFPYNNAAVQGTRRVLMGFKNPKTAIKTLAGITALSVLPKAYEYAKFHNDPDYQNLPARERYRNNIVGKLPNGKFVKVPVEPAYGAFGEATIEAMRSLLDKDPTAFKGAADALVNAYLPPMATGALQGLTQGTGLQGAGEGFLNGMSTAPIAGALNNKSFTGAPIVPKDTEGRTDKYEYDERTSSIAKKVGSVTGYSPMKVDYLLKSYGGDPARMILPLMSSVGGGNARDSLLKNFIADPTYSNTLSQDFYDAKDKLNAAYQDNKDLGIPLPKWYSEDMRKELTSSAKGSISKMVSGLRDQKAQIQSDKSLTKQQKTDQLLRIQKQINDIYLDINAKLSKQGIIR